MNPLGFGVLLIVSAVSVACSSAHAHVPDDAGADDGRRSDEGGGADGKSSDGATDGGAGLD
jgi:hypothetical protein